MAWRARETEMSKKKSVKPRIVVLCFVVLAFISVFVALGNQIPWIHNFLGAARVLPQRCGNAEGAFAFYNVGNADASCVYTNNEIGLIDTGIGDKAGTIIKRMKDLKVEALDFIVISHPHDDHAGGYLHIIQEITVKKLFILSYSENDFENPTLYHEVIRQSIENGIEIHYITHGMQVQIGGIHMSFYSLIHGVSEENNRSLIVKATIGESSCLYMGDAGEEIENRLLMQGYSIHSTILKVGHHGSKTASSASFLQAVQPTYAVISVGYNEYGHPAEETLNRISSVGATIYRTDVCNDVIFYAKDKTVDILVQ